jgi:hypothetical protein
MSTPQWMPQENQVVDPSHWYYSLVALASRGNMFHGSFIQVQCCRPWYWLGSCEYCLTTAKRCGGSLRHREVSGPGMGVLYPAAFAHRGSITVANSCLVSLELDALEEGTEQPRFLSFRVSKVQRNLIQTRPWIVLSIPSLSPRGYL